MPGGPGILLAEVGNQSGQLGPVGLDMGQELVLGRMSDIVAECLGEELVGRGEVFLAVSEQHEAPIVECRPGRFRHQRGLPQPGFPGDQENFTSPSGRDPLDGVGDGCQIGLPADHLPQTGAYAQAVRQRDGRDRLGTGERLPEQFHGRRPARADP